MAHRIFAAAPSFSALLCAGLLSFASCESGSSTGDDKATSNSIDSVKMNGEAPVQYGPDNPADDTITSTGTGEQVIQGNDGMAERQTPGGAAAGVKNGLNGTRTAPANNPPASPNTGSNPKMQSNTTDARTSGGSSKGSDAAGERR